MMLLIIERTIIPIVILVSCGFFARKFKILREGDERVFSAYLYFFALPSLFIINMSKLSINSSTLKLIAVSFIPVLIAVIILQLTGYIFKINKNFLHLLIITTIFGNVAYFGIPFLTFAFPDIHTQQLSVLIASSIIVASMFTTIILLELYKIKNISFISTFIKILIKLSRNPLIISILIGILLSVLKINIPPVIKKPMQMLGNSTTIIAFFMLGVFLFGKKYENLFLAFKLSLLKTFFMPLLTILFIGTLYLGEPQRTMVILMQGMPVAISFFVLSEIYSFYRKLVSSIILISTLGAIISLNIWLFFLS